MRWALLVLAACDDGFVSGSSEPFQVREGVFHSGALPSNPSAETPSIVYVASAGYVITQGRGNVAYDGLATKDATSVAAALDGIGTGYWVVPVDGPDVTQQGNLLFDLTADFTEEVPFGLQTLLFSAVDGTGRPAPPYESKLCVLPDFADGNFAACDPETPPQEVVLSLSWDTDVDLDLVVVAPDGAVLTSSAMSRDSNRDCVIDGMRLESLIFEETPPPGDYRVYASLAAACGQPAVWFDLTLHESTADGASWSVDSTHVATGELLAAQADGGASLGVFVTTLTFPSSN